MTDYPDGNNPRGQRALQNMFMSGMNDLDNLTIPPVDAGNNETCLQSQHILLPRICSHTKHFQVLLGRILGPIYNSLESERICQVQGILHCLIPGVTHRHIITTV